MSRSMLLMVMAASLRAMPFGREIERDGDGWKLSLVIDGERRRGGAFTEVREGAQRDHTALRQSARRCC